MASFLHVLSVLLAVITFYSVSANVVTYTVTFVPCVQGSTCPQGNPTAYNAAFALNGIIGLNLSLNVGDQLQFNLATNVSIHPLTICQNSPVPQFCQGATNSNLLNTPITQAGTNTSFTFTTAGTYYYGCNNHPGMGATIMVIQASSDNSSSTPSTNDMSNMTETNTSASSSTPNTNDMTNMTETNNGTSSSAMMQTSTSASSSSVMQTTTTTLSSSTTHNAGHRLSSAPVLLISVFTLIAIIFI